MHFCVDSSKRRMPGSLNGEGNHLEEKKLLGYVIPIVSEKCVELLGFKYTWWYLILADQEILECFRANGWDQIITVLKGRIRLQALNSVMLVFILLVSRAVQVLFALQQCLLMFTPSLLTAYKEIQDSFKLIAIICPLRTVKLDMRHCHSRFMDKNSHMYWWGCTAGGNPFPDRFAECWVSF